jgi:hypothetical protein
MDLLTLIFIVVAVIVLAAVVLGLLAWKKPETLRPLVNLLMKSDRARDKIIEKQVEHMAGDPELIDQMVEGQSSEVRDKVKKQFSGQQDYETKRLLEKAAAGEKITQQDLRKGKTAEESRAAAQAKAKRRAKAKQAKKNRKNTRKKR